ncbi:LOW QUALITY PROTEIN: uncharacterized protein V5649_004356 [Rhynchonycteris naso]
MSDFQNTTFSSIIFPLPGVPGLEAFHAWIFIPFFFLYITAFSGNNLILFVIVTQPSLHEPTYYFLSMLSTADLGLSISTLVTMLCIFWFNARKISFNACLSQIFFIKLFTVMESSVFLAMAFDHFVAISNLLRYTSILTDSRIAYIGVAIVFRGTLVLTTIALLKRLPYCHSHVLYHSHCFPPDVMKLSCTDTKISNSGLTAMIFTSGVDSLIFLSDVLIIKTVLSIASPKESFCTCISHIGTLAVFYIPLISLSFVHRFGKWASPYVNIMIANTYLLILPVMNSIIYSVKTKQIRRTVVKILHSKDTLRSPLSGDLICPPGMLSSQSYVNISFFQPPAFLMIGIPGLEVVHGWISIPFSCMYTAALAGNCLILLAVKRTPSLHQPMYYFLSILAVTDVGLTLCTLPTTLAVLWFDHRLVAFNACLVQMFFLHSFSVMESSVLLAMSFDRFVAISKPLHYATVLTNNVILKIGLAIVARATLFLFPLPFLLKRLNFCPGKILLSHSFCFHADVMKKACADITVNILYGLFVVLSTVGVDSLLIVLSYTLILYTVMGLASPRQRIRALNTCVSHILAVLVFYIPVIGVSMIHRFGRHLSHIVQALIAYVYLMVPPVLNPIIYSVKSKPIREAMLRVLRGKRQG